MMKTLKLGAWLIERPGPWEKIVPGWEYTFDRDALRRFSARPNRCRCKYCWYKFKLVGSWPFLIIMWVNIKGVSDKLSGLCYMGTSWV